jgi:putative hydrolase of the HAD superfamily
MSKIRAAIFDCYSTLIDIKTNEQKDDIFHYLSLYLQYYGAKTDAGQLRADIDLKREQHLKSKDEPYPEVDLEIIFSDILKAKGLNSPFLAESCCKLFRLLSRERFQLFPDSLPVLEDMRKSKYPLAVVSDAQKVFCPEEGEILGIRQFFRVFILSTDFGFRKPDSRLFTIACTLLGMPPADVVYIGNDPEADVKGAKQVGMQAILLDRNSTNSNHKLKPDFHASNLWEAWDWIKKRHQGK